MFKITFTSHIFGSFMLQWGSYLSSVKIIHPNFVCCATL